MDLKQQLEKDEGRSKFVYLDTLGFKTIGIGKLVDSRKGGGLSDSEIDFIFNNSVKTATEGLQRGAAWTVQLDEVRRNALVNMTFQMGVEGVMAFRKMLAAMQAGNWEQAYREAKNSKWAQQTPLRAERIARQILTGVVQ